MPDAPLISVLIDTYNYGSFVEEAIESVLSQDFPSERLEVVVVDDGSTDDTSARVEKYDARVRYMRKDNGGQASAFNFGFKHTSGELIVLLDADDFFLPGKLRRVMEAFEANPKAGMVYHKLPELHADGRMAPAPGFQRLSGFLPSDQKKLASYRLHQTSCLAFRRSLLAELMPMPVAMRIQADAYLELIAVLITPIVAIAEELAVYRIHGKNLCALDVMYESPEATKRLVASTSIVVREALEWIREHRERIGSMNPQPLLDGITLPLIEREFRFDTPDRLRYFRFLLRRNRALHPIEGWWRTLARNFTALGALMLGYPKARHLSAWWRR